MKRMLVIGNWKMNKNMHEAVDLSAMLASDVRVLSAAGDGVDVVICPPFTALASVRASIDGTALGLGAQNCHHEIAGAFTGEISAGMLADAGCTYVLVGHSERRRDQDESDALIARKASTAIAVGLKPIICIGETLTERQGGHTFDVIGRQLRAVCEAVGPSLQRAIIAYEPVWAIGTGLAATPVQAEEVHASIAALLSEYDMDLPILYGGSVTADNAVELFVMPHISGGLIGGASLKADVFASIVVAAHAVSGAAS